jgi:dTDP-4-dehydrorhamnose 3,5-epimerase
MSNEINASETPIPGCRQIQFSAHSDCRGIFVKVFHRPSFAENALEVNFAEVFYTVSYEKVLRGMHLQLPPADHSKLVYCVAGCVMDVALDLRRGSPTFSSHMVVELSAKSHNGLFLPAGVAHGFYVLQPPAIIVYHVTSKHEPELDAGVRWDSFGAPWPDEAPVVSLRDAVLPPLSRFNSPFEFPASATISS